MAIRMRDAMFQGLDGLRYEPVERRVRALLGDDEVVDSRRPLLVWEPRRVVPSFAVPIEDVRGALVAEPPAPRPDAKPPVLHPGIPFAEHSTAGEALSLRAGAATRERVAFAPADPDLAGHVVLDFKGFDAWLEEDEPLLGHARDPTTASTCAARRARCASSARGRCWPRPTARCCCGRRACPRASTSRARTYWPTR